ncbi:hypothetical protein BDP27DRAFT_1370467 [Rhodocollybia butyracea]|uniref:Uncharacterized protein n=1 Tax=Rhodocollybia butyracea TaxID=206335 RepID=A0A9P5PD28_9AGAR|nr:hypothetical protein BDP27DRAFT_1370467 [Rhodocollybia butyracea]
MRLSFAYPIFLVAYVVNAVPLDVPSQIRGSTLAPRAQTPIPLQPQIQPRVTFTGPSPIQKFPVGLSSSAGSIVIQENIKVAVTNLTQTVEKFEKNVPEITNTVLQLGIKGKKVTFIVECKDPCPCNGYYYAKENGARDENKERGIQCRLPHDKPKPLYTNSGLNAALQGQPGISSDSDSDGG